MATHSSVLAWRIPGTGEPVGLPVFGVTQSRIRLKRLSSSSRGWEQGLMANDYKENLGDDGNVLKAKIIEPYHLAWINFT